MTTTTEVHGLDQEPESMHTVGVGVAIRREDRAVALVLVVNDTPYLVNYSTLAALAAAVEEGVRILDGLDESKGRPS